MNTYEDEPDIFLPENYIFSAQALQDFEELEVDPIFHFLEDDY